MSEKRQPDFTGWATKFGIKCTDGRTILPGAFKDMEGKKVPIVWGHIHDDPDMVLGHAFLYNRPEGVWTEGFFNNNPKAQSTKEALRNGDVDGLSIYANELKHVNGRQVEHGNIRELSVVLAGANKGATIQNVVLAHGDDFFEELDDECVVYNDDAPLFHGEDEAKAQKKKALEDEEEDADTDEEDKEDSKDEGGEEDENVEDEEKKLQHADDEGDDDKTLQQVWDSMSEEQKNLCYFMIAKATGDEGGEKDEEDKDMKHNAFERGTNVHPDDVLSHADQQAIIKRGRELGSMRAAWEEALETNEVLSHDVFNDDGTKQTYGIANIDYLFPEYTELNPTPEMIQRDDEWVSVLMNGVTKTPHARMKTTVANITMEEARAKGYAKGDKKDPEVFNLLHRQVSPQTIYKYQELDQDDVIDITEFDVIAWVKAEMRIMLNEEVARAILIGDGRLYNDKYKIKEDNIKPIVSDDDLYAVKVTVTAGQDDAQTAKNGIRSMIKSRKFYKGSGNMVFFTSEDWLSEWLLLEDGFGHELYADATALAKKLRVNKIVTCPLLEDLEIDGQKVMGIALDLRDYGTGTDRRGKITFFDDFDIEFNKNQFLLETRLSGMLRKPYSAMIMKVASATKGAPHYDEVTPVGNENPKSLGWYNKEGTVYRKSDDVAVVSNKTYYSRSINVPQENP